MHQLNKISIAIAIVGLSTAFTMSQSVAKTPVDMLANDTVITKSQPGITSVAAPMNATKATNVSPSDALSNVINEKNTQMAISRADTASPVTNAEADENVSLASRAAPSPEQQLINSRKSARLLNKFLPVIPYHTANLPAIAQQVNTATWKKDEKIDRIMGTKLQALLNWHQHGVGAVDGYWGKNTRKAMQAFQKAQGLNVTQSLDEATWEALNKILCLVPSPCW